MISPVLATTIAIPSSFTFSPFCFTASLNSAWIYSSHSSPTDCATYGCTSHVGRELPNPFEPSGFNLSTSFFLSNSYGTISTSLMAKTPFRRLAPSNASRIAFLDPATIIICCFPPLCTASTIARCMGTFGSSDTRISKLNLATVSSRSFIPFFNCLFSFVFFIFSSTFVFNSFPLSISNFANNANAATATKSMARLIYSAFKSTSVLAPDSAAATPAAVMNPPSAAPDPKEK
mmetsp:Transcript_2196/g.2637  ORF Transcript_2196/g.2637 Transcript_2196/m.2637 type:complete len:233 (+) Transcript_2196:138-836(+)